MRRLVRRAVFAGSGLIPMIVNAQAYPRTDTLSTVHVSVLRTPFDLSDAPFSIALVSPSDATIARPGMSLDEVLGRLAGVQADNRFNFALGDRISMRGLGARSQFGVRGIRVIVDGIPATLADGQTTLNNVDLASLGHAEVLRGPASALYGNASGGVVLLESASAPPRSFAPSVRIVSGSYGLRSLQVGGGGEVGRGSYMVTGDRVDNAGYRAFSDARNAHVNGVATYDAGWGQWKFVLNAEQHNAHNSGGLTDSLEKLDPRQAAATNLLHVTGERGKQVQGGMSMRAAAGPGELRISTYVLRRTLTNPIPTNVIDLRRLAGGWRAAYGITTGNRTRSVTTLAGVESDRQNDNRQNHSNRAGRSDTLSLDQRENVTSLSPFLQVKGTLDRLTMLGGLRYDHFRFAASDRFITATNPDDSGIRDMSATSPSFGVTYTIAQAIGLYANVATSFQTPTTTELANRPTGAGGFNPSLNPERVHSTEVGIRGAFRTRAIYHLDAYRMRITGELVPYELASSPGRDFYRNVGVAEHRGVEAEGTAFLSTILTVRGTYAYTDAEVIRDTAAITGHRAVPGVAAHLATFAVDLGHADGVFASAELRAQNRVAVNDANTVFSPGYRVANLRLKVPYRTTGAIIGGVTNVFDTRYNTSVVINAAGGRYFEPGAARAYYLGVQWNPGYR